MGMNDRLTGLEQGGVTFMNMRYIDYKKAPEGRKNELRTLGIDVTSSWEI